MTSKKIKEKEETPFDIWKQSSVKIGNFVPGKLLHIFDEIYQIPGRRTSRNAIKNYMLKNHYVGPILILSTRIIEYEYHVNVDGNCVFNSNFFGSSILSFFIEFNNKNGPGYIWICNSNPPMNQNQIAICVNLD